jgi:hypothetical protein
LVKKFGTFQKGPKVVDSLSIAPRSSLDLGTIWLLEKILE